MAAELVLMTTDISFVLFLNCGFRSAVGPLWISVRPHWGGFRSVDSIIDPLAQDLRGFFISLLFVGKQPGRFYNDGLAADSSTHRA